MYQASESSCSKPAPEPHSGCPGPSVLKPVVSKAIDSPTVTIWGDVAQSFAPAGASQLYRKMPQSAMAVSAQTESQLLEQQNGSPPWFSSQLSAQQTSSSQPGVPFASEQEPVASTHPAGVSAPSVKYMLAVLATPAARPVPSSNVLEIPRDTMPSSGTW